MAATIQMLPSVKPSVQLALVPNPRPVKFDAARDRPGEDREAPMSHGQVSLSLAIETVLRASVPLEVAVEFMRPCVACNAEERFVADRLCAVGLVGYCSRCGEPDIAPFTRTTTAEVA